jgi:hypothetical protein
MRRLLLTLHDTVTAEECGECRCLEGDAHVSPEDAWCSAFRVWVEHGKRHAACIAAETEALELELAAWEEP